jgi:uncharacterized protein YehS (DUF1456 family)
MADIILPAGEKGDTVSQAEKILAGKSLLSSQDVQIIKVMAAREYDQFKQQLGKVLKITDEEAVEIVMGIVCAHFVPGEPLWVRFIGASRSGKTELLRAIISYGKGVDKPDVMEIEVFTPASIRGGLQEGCKFLDWAKGKLVITKDLAAILTTRPEIRREIMGLSRSLKDGSLTSFFGTVEGYVHQEGEYDWLIATTPVFEGEQVMEDLLGARYVDLQWKVEKRLEITRRALDNNPKLKELRIALNVVTRNFLDWIKYRQATMPAPMPDDLDFIADLADMAALLRSPVKRDKYHNLTSMPMPEVGTDIAQSFARISQGLWLLGITNYKPYLWRLAKDCIPSVRQTIIEELLNASIEMTAYTIAQNIQIPQTTVTYKLEDLQLLQITERSRQEPGLWKLKPDIKNRLENFKAISSSR